MDGGAGAGGVDGGFLLPDDKYEGWTENRREHVRLRYHDLLRAAERWDALLAEEPADEDAHVALMQQRLEAGDHRAALRQFERMDAALRRELGVGPGRQALAMRDRILAETPGQSRPGPAGRPRSPRAPR